MMIANQSFGILLLLSVAWQMVGCSRLEEEEPKSETDLGKIKPGEVWHDTRGVPIQAHGGGIYYEDGVYYWFGEDKTGVSQTDGQTCNGFRVNTRGVSCYSSSDLVTWEYEGPALEANTDDPEHELHISKVIERPKVVRNRETGNYVMWIHIDSGDYSLAAAGLAVSDHVTGPYRYMGSVRPHNEMSRDQTIFVDDDGKAYRFFSSEDNKTMRVSEMSSDYLEHSVNTIRTLLDRWREAPAVFKHRSTYFLMTSGATGWDPNEADYATADNLFGPWVRKGNPFIGEHADVTFYSQSTFVLPVQGKPGAFIYMGDRWNRSDLQDSRYVWLPMELTGDQLTVKWYDEWDLSVFN